MLFVFVFPSEVVGDLGDGWARSVRPYSGDLR